MTEDGTSATTLGCTSALLNKCRRWTGDDDDLIDFDADVDSFGRCGGDVGYNGGMHKIDDADLLLGNTFVGRVISGVTVKDVGETKLDLVRST